MTARELMQKYSMQEHIENGAFVERHYQHEGTGRPASGAIYYYVAPDDVTQFHRIDCDEYWCYNAGAPLDVWQVLEDGHVEVARLGTQEGCEPLLHIRAGVIFASRHEKGCDDGTFISCITVPRFTYDGFEMIAEETMIEKYPQTAEFFR